LRRVLPLALLLLSGCAGYMRPIPVSDGQLTLLLLAGKRMNSPDPETFVYLRAGATGEWKRIGVWSGAARSAVLWKGKLWVLFRDSLCSYRLSTEGLERESTLGLHEKWKPSALALHGGKLYALRREGSSILLSRKSSPQEDWMHLAAALEVGSATVQFQAAGSGDALWILWRKRGRGGYTLPETFAAYYRKDRWELPPARALGGREFFISRDPAGRGLLVLAARGGGILGGPGRTSLCRVTPSGWEEPLDLGIPTRPLGSPVMGVGLSPAPADMEPGRENLLVFAGRRTGVGVYQAEASGPELPGDWKLATLVQLDLYGPETLLGGLMVLAALIVGFGLGVAAVRRRRIFPQLPGQPRPASLAARIGAWCLDNILVTAVFYAGLAVAPLPSGAVLRDSRLLFLLIVSNRLLLAFYCGIFEARWGATPGKLITGLRVAMLDGHRPTARAAIVRNLFRLFDEALICPLPGLIMAIVSRHAQRLGDVFARTVVSTSRSVHEIAEDRRRKSDRFGLP